MMIGERTHGTVGNYLSPVNVPPWTLAGDDYYSNLSSYNVLSPTTFSDDHSLFLTALQRFLPSNTAGDAVSEDDDDFRMYEFKVKKCTRGRSHDWTECPYAHPGEKARRRNPRKYVYSGSACPEFRKGGCPKGDACEHAHGVFECWLHPARYRTQLCKDGAHCTRRVCFFAHSPEQLRVLSPRAASDSPPPAYAGSPEAELVASMRQLHLMPGSWRFRGGGVLSPRISKLPSPPNGSFVGSVPGTPTRALTRTGFGLVDSWDEDEPVLERVESGRGLREKMFEKLSKDNPLDRVGSSPNQTPNLNVYRDANPDLGWVSDLLN